MENDDTSGPPQGRPIGALLVCVALAISACGADDDASESTPVATTPPTTRVDSSESTPSTTSPATTAPADPATTSAGTTESPSTTSSSATTTETADLVSTEPAVCAPFLQVSAAFSGQPDPATIGALLDDVDANAPDEIADELTILTTNSRTVLDTGDFGVFETPVFETAIATSETWMSENCDFATQTEIIATDYRYEGQAADYPAGRTAFTLVNGGVEAHELMVLRKNDDVDLSLEELSELPEAEAETMTSYVGAAFAGPPGARSNLIIELTPGDYIAVCVVPAGTTVAEDGSFTEGTGEPHVMLGMSFEFTVA